MHNSGQVNMLDNGQVSILNIILEIMKSTGLNNMRACIKKYGQVYMLKIIKEHTQVNIQTYTKVYIQLITKKHMLDNILDNTIEYGKDHLQLTMLRIM